jgi:hypothetical protein
MPPDAAPAQTSSDSPPAAPDVFLSYAREDRPAAERIAKTLTDQPWSVWWDRLVLGGQPWHGEIARALGAARCVVVLWSSASIQSHWVLDEEGEGKARGVLVPVLLEDVEIPLGFRQIQTVNLAGAGDPALDGLIAGVARVLGGPIPKPTKRTDVRSYLRVWAPLIAAALCAAVAIVLYLSRITETVVDLEVKTSEASFVSAREQDATDLMTVSTIDASGLDSIQLPRARERPESQMTAPRDGGLAIRIASGSEGARTGAITLPPISLTTDAHVTLAASDPRGFRLVLTRSSVPVGVNVRGPVLLTMAGGTSELVDFGAPKPLRIAPSARSAQFDVTRAGAPKPLLTSPIEISGLSLVRIDETVDTRRMEVSAVSTIVSGTLRLEALDGRPQVIGTGELLRFGESHGEITSIDLADGGLLLRFNGRVQRLESCAGGTCENRMPTYFDSMAARRPAWLVALAAVFVICLAAASRRSMRPW